MRWRWCGLWAWSMLKRWYVERNGGGAWILSLWAAGVTGANSASRASGEAAKDSLQCRTSRVSGPDTLWRVRWTRLLEFFSFCPFSSFQHEENNTKRNRDKKQDKYSGCSIEIARQVVLVGSKYQQSEITIGKGGAASFNFL